MAVVVERPENIKHEEFAALLERAFATYGLSVVTDRALPDARDGLKPVQRRILYCMYVNRYLSNRPTVKSAEVVGRVLGDFHPHGSEPVYEAGARMAQDFTMRYPLIEGQGNFGSIDGDPPAAFRYTEMRLTPLAELLLQDIEKATVPLKPTYKQDPKVVEPEYLPGRIPPVINPSSGIAVGMSTNIPPHNLVEVVAACIALLDKPEMPVSELMRHIKGPDFPSGGTVVGEEGIREYLATGKGRLLVRGTVRLEETPRQRSLVITELPPLGKDRIKSSIVKAINERKLDGLVPDVRDESDTEKGIRIVLDLKRDANPSQTLNALYRHTEVQTSVPVQMVFLFGQSWEPARQPKQVGMVELLSHYDQHQLDVLTRRTQHDLRQAQERLHVVDGLIIGAANAQQIVRIFQQAANRQVAKEEIKKRYKLTDVQADVIASMTLAQVTRLDSARYAEEKKELTTRVKHLQGLLDSRARMVTLLKEEMQATIKTYGDARRTMIDREGAEEVEEVAPAVERQPLVLALTLDGALKALPPETYRPPRRGSAAATRGDEQLAQLVSATTAGYVLLVTAQGRVHMLPGHQIPEGTRSGRGDAVRRLINLGVEDRVVALVPVEDFDEDLYLVLFSRQGRAKKSALSEYRSADSGGLLDFKLAGDDEIVVAYVAPAEGEHLVVTSGGKALRFGDSELRATGRSTQGVQAVSLTRGARRVGPEGRLRSSHGEGDHTTQRTTDANGMAQPDARAPTDAHGRRGGQAIASRQRVVARGESVVGAAPVSHRDGRYLLLVSTAGFGKKTRLTEFPIKGRATGGVAAAALPPGTQLAAAVVVGEDTDVIVSTGGGAERLPAARVSTQGRATRGVGLVRPAKDARVETVVVVPSVPGG